MPTSRPALLDLPLGARESRAGQSRRGLGRARRDAAQLAPLRLPRTATQSVAGRLLLAPPLPPGGGRRNATAYADEGKRPRFRNGGACLTDHINANFCLSHGGAHDHTAELHQRRYECSRPNMLDRSVEQPRRRFPRFRVTGRQGHLRPPRTEPGVGSRPYFEHAHAALPNGLRFFMKRCTPRASSASSVPRPLSKGRLRTLARTFTIPATSGSKLAGTRRRRWLISATLHHRAEGDSMLPGFTPRVRGVAKGVSSPSPGARS